ncbi:hypothetical protein ACFL40_05455 [candidate division KSB1 bacterium]
MKGYDYSQHGAYFITVIVKNRECLFGEVEDERMVLNNAGAMINNVWEELPRYYTGVDIDVFQIMPNHVHGIIILNVGAGPRACPNNKKIINNLNKKGQPQGIAPTVLSLGDIVGRFKSFTTKKYIEGIADNHRHPFNKQRLAA